MLFDMEDTMHSAILYSGNMVNLNNSTSYSWFTQSIGSYFRP